MGTPYLAEIKIVSFNFAPRGWALCNGQLIPLNMNFALFSLLGTTYGGNGQTTFALPDLRGKVPVCFDGSEFVLGQTAGEYNHTLIQSEMPAHMHLLMADATTAATANTSAATASSVLGQSGGFVTPGTGTFPVSMYSTGGPSALLAPQVISNTGGSQAHINTQPYLTLNFIIALQGVYPSQN
jgi:microcystin-dependent protein